MFCLYFVLCLCVRSFVSTFATSRYSCCWSVADDPHKDTCETDQGKNKLHPLLLTWKGLRPSLEGYTHDTHTTCNRRKLWRDRTTENNPKKSFSQSFVYFLHFVLMRLPWLCAFPIALLLSSLFLFVRSCHKFQFSGTGFWDPDRSCDVTDPSYCFHSNSSLLRFVFPSSTDASCFSFSLFLWILIFDSMANVTDQSSKKTWDSSWFFFFCITVMYQSYGYGLDHQYLSWISLIESPWNHISCGAKFCVRVTSSIRVKSVSPSCIFTLLRSPDKYRNGQSWTDK